jgi:hypothetical protein
MYMIAQGKVYCIDEYLQNGVEKVSWRREKGMLIGSER